MGTMAMVQLGISAIGTGLSIAGNLSAYSTAKAQAAQALRSNERQLAIAENTGNLQAQQQSSERTRRYNEVISSQTALWAARGVQLQSGTVSSVAQQSTEAYTRDVNTVELNRLNRLASLALQGADVTYASSYAVGAAHTRMVGGITNSLLSFAGTAAGMGTKAFDFGSGSSSSAVATGGMPGYGGTGSTASSYGTSAAPGFV
jgi:hypothetical protein